MIHVLHIIPAAERSDARTHAAACYDERGAGADFALGLNASGNWSDAATHYWSAVSLTAEQEAECATTCAAMGWTHVAYDLEREPGTPDEVFASLGLQRKVKKGGV